MDAFFEKQDWNETGELAFKKQLYFSQLGQALVQVRQIHEWRVSNVFGIMFWMCLLRPIVVQRTGRFKLGGDRDSIENGQKFELRRVLKPLLWLSADPENRSFSRFYFY